MSERQNDELMVWRNSDEGKATIADGRAKEKVKRAKLAKEKEDVNKNGGGGDSNPKRKKKYQNQVAKAAKKLLTSSLEAEKVEADTIDTKLDTAIQRLFCADVLAMVIVPLSQDSADEDAETEKAAAEKANSIQVIVHTVSNKRCNLIVIHVSIYNTFQRNQR